jgi:mono/diheme cytochrome c family protein
MRRLLALTLLSTLAVSCKSSGGGNANLSPAADAKAAKPAAVTAAAVTAAAVAMGDSIFNNGSCARCHGKGGVGATNAPSLAGPKFLQMTTGSFEEIVATIVSGVPKEKIKDPTHPNPMGARGGRMALTDPQIQSVAAYVWTLSHK